MVLRPKQGIGTLRFSANDVLMKLPAKSTGFETETETWINRATQAGGAFTGKSKNVANEIIKALQSRSYNSKIVYLLPFLGANLSTARVPLRDSLVVGIATNTGFVDADFSESTGLQGNGTSKYLDSLIKPSRLGSGNNGGLGWIENNITLAGNPEAIGGNTLIPTLQRFCIDLRSTFSAFRWGDPTNGAQNASTAANGHYYGQRTAATNREIYYNGSLLASNTTSDSANGSTNQNVLVCGSFENAIFYPYPGRGACAYMTDGSMTASEVSDFNTLLQRHLIAPTGRPS